MIVLCDRGAVARVAKGQAVRAGGGGGFILANVADGAGSTDPDAHVIPAIHVDATAGDALRLWLATGEGHMGRITAADQPSSNPDAADIVAFFSSRGPYPTYDFLGPNVAAPGVAIFAAGSGYAGGNSVPGMFGPVSGTSMATPHIAGAAALIKAVHPEWTDAEVLSAMITTGVNTLRKEDGVTPADIHDIGGGRISLADAVRAGLVLDETVEGFLAQNPAQDGDPGALNIAELVRQTCVVRCGWERTVKATVDGSWTITAPDYITVTPAEFTLAAGETQALSIEVYSAEMPMGEYVFGQVGLIPADGSLPDQHIPAVVRSAGSTLPLRTQVVATRSQGSTVIAGIESLGIDEFTYVVKGVSTAEQQELSVAQDSDNGSAYDDVTDGVATVLVPFPDGAEQFIVEIAKSESPDLDLRVGLDFNGDGLPSQDEQFCSAATPSAIELCAFNLGGTLAGWPPFWISVQNWQASAEDAVDAFTLAVTAVSTEDTGMLTVSAPDSVIAGEPWDLSLNWTSPGEQGAIGYGVVSVYRTAEQTAASLLGTFDLRMVREADDVSTKLPDLVSARTAFPVEVVIGPNYENVPRNYEIYLPLPEGVSYVDGSGGTLVGNEVVIDVSKDVGDTTSTTLAFEARVRSSLAGETVTFTANNVVDNANTVTETTTADVDVSAYVFSGFLNPTKPDSTVIAGRPALLRFRLTDGSRGGFLTDEEVALRVTNDIGDIMVEDTFKSVFLFGYVHALNTREYDEGTYTVTAILPDGSEHSMPLNVKKWRWFH